MKLNITLDIDEKDILSDIEKYFALRLTKKQLVEFLKASPRLAAEVAWSNLDTYCRDLFIDTFIEYLGLEEMYWPTHGDDKAYSELFYARFKIKCEEKGINCLFG